MTPARCHRRRRRLFVAADLPATRRGDRRPRPSRRIISAACCGAARRRGAAVQRRRRRVGGAYRCAPPGPADAHRAERDCAPQTAEAGLWLVFALLKRDATDLVVRKAVELGRPACCPVITERTNAARVNADAPARDRHRGRRTERTLTVPRSSTRRARLDAVLAAWPAGRRLFAAFERSSAHVARRRHRRCDWQPPRRC